MNIFPLIIVSYNEVIYNGPVVYCGIVTPEGSLGLEARHEPVLGVLKENSSILLRDPAGAERNVQIKNGMFSFKNNTCMLTVSAEEKK